jgi:hypothetical protein
MNNNRDYFTKPVQSGSRSGSDYGRTRLNVRRSGGDRMWYVIILIVVIYFAVQVAR